MNPKLDFWPAFGIAYAVTTLLTLLIVGGIRCALHRKIKSEYRGRVPDPVAQDEADEPKNGGWWLGVWVAWVEITGYFFLFVFDVDNAGAFVAGWIALKMATGWHRFALAKESHYYPRMGFAALTLNLLNVLFVLGGVHGLFAWLT